MIRDSHPRHPGSAYYVVGKIAYDAYGESRGWTVVDGARMSPWEGQTEELKDAWANAAAAVLDWASDFLTP